MPPTNKLHTLVVVLFRNTVKRRIHIFTARERSLGQGNIFGRVCQELCSQGGLPQCMLGYHTPPDQAPPKTRHPPPPSRLPQTRPPQTRHPPDQAPLRHRHPQDQPPPLRSACREIRSTSGRYASYWNAILLFLFLQVLW